jgi:beta-N-acetylhexosaminidase
VTRACILGCSGPELTPAERAFFEDAKPWGFVLFKRNTESPEQVRALTSALRAAVGRDDAPILIDQEGGRVQRMGPPHWPKYPTGRAYGEAGEGDALLQRELARLGARLMAEDLRKVGVNADAVPVLDVAQPGAHDVIGDRAYGADPELVARLGRAAAEGLMAGGVLPVIKHIPGHGRAMADSHLNLPVVEADLEALRAIDFRPFRANSDMPLGMTAHVVYTAIDPKHPGTQSKKVIRLIREEIGFQGLLMTDDVSMKALTGSFKERSERAIDAGCDIVLHCNGEPKEMEGVVEGCGKLKGHAERRAEAALARVARDPEPFDEAAARARFEAVFGR